MEIRMQILQIAAAAVGSLGAALSIPIFLQLHWPSPTLWLIKLFASAFSPILFLVGVLSVIIGLITYSLFHIWMGIYVALFFYIHIYRITHAPLESFGLKHAFGANWESKLGAEQKIHFLSSRAILRLPKVPIPRFEQNISFATIVGTERQLLCDVWQPNVNITPSGLAFIYLHGSAWALLDKDLGTRPFFGHLVAQGHVVMDVAYRLSYETDMMSMINDVKRAIYWMKENASTYGVNPTCIVVGGGSAGAHLAMMAAYTSNKPQFTPNDLDEKNLSVCGVVSLYGPPDLKAMHYHTNQQFTTRTAEGKPKKILPIKMSKWLIKAMGKSYYRLHFDKDFTNAGVFPALFGGHPNECPEQYALFSPITHVDKNCPPTMLLQGDHDLMVSLKSLRDLFSRLLKEKVVVVMHILPQTDHGFDLMLPKISPSAHTAMYDVERFLAFLCKKTTSLNYIK